MAFWQLAPMDSMSSATVSANGAPTTKQRWSMSRSPATSTRKCASNIRTPPANGRRAGLIARDVTNFGVDSATQTGDGTSGVAGRYQKVHVNPVTTAMATAGNNSWEGNRRLTTGAATTSAGGGGTPQYPNAWCRLQRVGQVFTIYRSDDGIAWTQLGATTFDPAMPDTLYVGIDYSPENGNVTDGLDLRGMWLAKFRDYGDYVKEVAKPALSFQKTATGLAITFEGTLQSVDTITGAWADVAGATSPYTESTRLAQLNSSERRNNRFTLIP